jgi:hypothetical protein
MPEEFKIRKATPVDREAAYWVCLKTGAHGDDGEALFTEDPDALGRIYVGPYLKYEPDLALVLEDGKGVCGYCLGAMDSRKLYDRYEQEWRHGLARDFPEPGGDPSRWTPLERVYHLYHHPDYYCPEPYELYPSQLHIDLMPKCTPGDPLAAILEATSSIILRPKPLPCALGTRPICSWAGYNSYGSGQ